MKLDFLNPLVLTGLTTISLFSSSIYLIAQASFTISPTQGKFMTGGRYELVPQGDGTGIIINGSSIYLRGPYQYKTPKKWDIKNVGPNNITITKCKTYTKSIKSPCD